MDEIPKESGQQVYGSSGPPVSSGSLVVYAPSPVGLSPAAMELPANSPVATASSQVKAAYGDKELMEAVDAVQFTCAYKICGHLSLDKEKRLKVCSRAAGLDTDHPEVGRCFEHEPGSRYLPISPYARHLKHAATLQELFADVEESKAEFRGLTQEMTMARTILAAQLKLLQNRTERTRYSNQELYGQILQCLEAIRKLAESAAKIQNLNSQTLTFDSVTAFLWQTQRILEEELVEPKVRLRVFDRIATEASFSL